MTDVDLMPRFFIQVLVILGACKAAGWFGTRYLGQTRVVMEMLAGILLGPSLFGELAPKLQARLFPVNATYLVNGVPQIDRHPSMAVLYVVAQLGLVFYMFLVGLEFNRRMLKDRAKGAMLISAAGVVVPFGLGAGIAFRTHHGWGLFAPGIAPGVACIYLGAAMCITAFPVLARIVGEHRIVGTRMGTLALGAGAAGDVLAWVLLAIVLAFAKGSWTYAAYAIGGGLVFVFVMARYAPRLFTRSGGSMGPEVKMPSSVFASVMILLFVSACLTDAIGIHAVFGAFVVGMTMPRGAFAEELRRKLEAVTAGVLIPFFFVYAGLSTKIGLIDSPRLALIASVIVVASILGKAIPCAAAARVSGEGWRESWAIGVLMNARGMMELIIANIGLQQGVITPELYTILVVMAILTTVITSPIFRWIHSRYLGHLAEEARQQASFQVRA